MWQIGKCSWTVITIFIKNYVVSVINDVIFKIEFPKFVTFIWLRLVDYLIQRILVIQFIQTYCQTPYKIEKLFDIWLHFKRLRFSHLFDKKLNFVSIAENAEIAQYCQIFWSETLVIKICRRHCPKISKNVLTNKLKNIINFPKKDLKNAL